MNTVQSDPQEWTLNKAKIQNWFLFGILQVQLNILLACRHLFIVPAHVFIHKNIKMPTLKVQFQRTDWIFARTGGGGGRERKSKKTPSQDASPWFGVYLESVNIHWVCQKVCRLENLLIKPGLCFEDTCPEIGFSRCNSVAFAFEIQTSPKIQIKALNVA